MRPLLLSAFLLLAAWSASPAQPVPPPSVADEAAAVAELEKTWAGIEKSGPTGCRGLMSLAYRATALQWHPERVSKALALLEEMQDKDPASKTYGNFRWYWNQEHPEDLNAVEFVLQNGIVFWNLYHDTLPPDDRDRLRRMIDLGVHGLATHRVGVEYTNIFLMKAWNSIAIGEACGLASLADEGYRMFDQWIAETYRNGIHEYLSPTYYGTDVDSLVLIRSFAARPPARNAAEAALRFLWMQCRADWFLPGQRLAGPHARDYDYLTGHGFFDRYLFDWGWLSQLDPVSHPDGYKPSPLDRIPAVAPWTPPPLPANVVPRFVRLRFGGAPDQVATSYIGKSIAIGVAGRCVGAEDKFFTIQFDGGPRQVMANLFVDGRGDSYGQNKIEGKGGHRKAHHLVPLVASVQAGPAVLLLASFGSPASLPKAGIGAVPDLAFLATHLDLPDEAVLWQGEKEVAVAPGESAPLDPAQPIFVRCGNATVGFRFLQATDDTGKPLVPVFHRDGAAHHASRISWDQAAGIPRGEAHVLFLAVAREGLDDAGFAAFRKEIAALPASVHAEGDRITARAEAGTGTPLEIEADLRTGAKKGTSLPAGILEVNGVEVGQPLLEKALPPGAIR